MTSNHHAPYVLGYTRATMVGTTGGEGAIRSESQEADLSSDCRLQLACRKVRLDHLLSKERQLCVILLARKSKDLRALRTLKTEQERKNASKFF